VGVLTLISSGALKSYSPSPLPVASSDSSTNGWVDYENKKFKVRLKYLNTWSYHLKDNPWDSFVIFFPKDYAYSREKDAKVAVEVESLNSLISLDEYVDSFKKEILNDTEGAKLLGVGGYSLLNSPAYKVIYEFKRNNKTLKKEAFITLRDKKAYIVYYEARVDIFSKFEKIVEEMAKSLEIEDSK
jgi:hypothetical protein